MNAQGIGLWWHANPVYNPQKIGTYVFTTAVQFAANVADTAKDNECLDAPAALDQLVNSIRYTNKELSFEIPENFPNSDHWNILISGRMEQDGFGMSVHYLSSENENKEWQTGKRYIVPLKGENKQYSELWLLVSLEDENGKTYHRNVDLLNVITNSFDDSAQDYNIERSGTAELRFYDDKMNEVTKEANWYQLTLKALLQVEIERDIPDRISVYLTPTGTQTAEYREQIAVAAVAEESKSIEIPLDFSKQLFSTGHLQVALEYGSTALLSDVYNISYEVK